MTGDSLQRRIDRLATGLKLVSARLGYSEVRERGRLVKYRLHTDALEDLDIPVQPGLESLAKERLLDELEKVARRARPSLLHIEPPPLPVWLVPEAVPFCDQPEAGLHRFGKSITIRGWGPGRQADEYQTKEQLVHVSTTSLEIFRYFPTERERYRDDMTYRAATGWNFSMHYHIETRGLEPMCARDALGGMQQDVLDAILRDLAASAGAPSGEMTGDVFREVLTVVPIRRRRG